MAVIIAASTATLLVLERTTRQLLPLAALLNLSLIFPDKAPARFAVARQSGKPRDLQARMQRAQASGHTDEAGHLQGVIEMVLALSVHDPASRGHSERVRVFTDMIADELKIPEKGRNRLRWAALLHDIGKLEVAPAILNKPGPPTDEEWAVLHRHPAEGARLAAPLLPWLGEWGLAVMQHHERFDGTGYPSRLRGNEISLAARIVAVADSYEVMTAPRAYKRPMSVSAARRELVRVAGTQLDPTIVRAFLNVSVGRLWRTIGFGAWLAQVPALGRLLDLGGLGGMSGPAAGMGIATAMTATVLAVGGFVGPAPGASATAVSPGPVAAVTTPTHGAPPSRPPLPGLGSAPASATPSSAPTTAGPARRGTATPDPTSLPSSTPVPNPPAPTPTPAPTPAPWNCSACTNTDPSCTSYCSGINNANCTTYCTGNNNKVCTSYCVGENNHECVEYCQGPNNPVCTQNCQSVTVAARFTTTGMRLRTVEAALPFP